MTRARLRLVWLSLGYAGLVAVALAMLLPAPGAGPDIPFADKWLHVAVYLIVMLWFAQLAKDIGSLLRWAVALTVYSLVLELAQSLVSWRQTDGLDAVANLIGLALGWVLARWTAAGRVLSMLPVSPASEAP